MTYIYDLASNDLIEAEIVQASSKLPLKKDGWKFDWNKLLKDENNEIYVLRLKNAPFTIEGMVQLKIENGMLIMEVIENAPHNYGSSNKRFDYVAGCLIAFGCRKSFSLVGPYKGYLTFTSKTNLMELYKSKYGASQALGQRMYIDDINGLKLINKYLN